MQLDYRVVTISIFAIRGMASSKSLPVTCYAQTLQLGTIEAQPLEFQTFSYWDIYGIAAAGANARGVIEPKWLVSERKSALKKYVR